MPTLFTLLALAHHGNPHTVIMGPAFGPTFGMTIALAVAAWALLTEGKEW